MRSLILVCLAACSAAVPQRISTGPDGGTGSSGTTNGPLGHPGGPLALVYRGPAACDFCSSALATVLVSASENFEVRFVGPDEDSDVTPDVLSGAALYAQPGGGISVWDAFDAMSGVATAIDGYVHGGGRYLGVSEGAYLAGKDPGFLMLPGDSNNYITSQGASVTDTDDTVIRVNWRGQTRYMYFQDGPLFNIDPGTPNVTTLATYDNGTVAAVVTPFGAGKVGVVGTHPEADLSWYAAYGLVDPDGLDADCAHDLIDALMQ